MNLSGPTGKDPLATNPGSVIIRILLIEDNEDDALLIRETLGEVKDAPFALEWVDTAVHSICAPGRGWDRPDPAGPLVAG